jgi:hypothetical protein
VDNGLSSWIGRCCKRKRGRAGVIPEVGSNPLIALLPGKKLQLKCPKAPVDSAPSAPLVVDIQQPRSLSVSADPEIVAHGSYPQKVAPLQHGPNLKQTTAGSGAAAPKPRDDSVDGNLSFHKTVGSGGSQTTSIQPIVQHVGVRGDTGLITGRVHTFPPPPAVSAGSAFAPPSFHNQPTSFSQYPRSPHLRESSTVSFAVAGLSTCAKILTVMWLLFYRRLSNENRNRQVSLLRPLTSRHFPGRPNAQPPLEVPAMRPQNRRLWTSSRRRWTSVPSRSTGPLERARPHHDYSSTAQQSLDPLPHPHLSLQ